MTRTAATANLRTPKLQQQTLSVRISDAMRLRLARARHLRASITGTYVSTSAIAKQFLESAREDRLDLVHLLAHPSEILVEIRRKGDAQHLLSRAEWQVLAHVVRHGMEACSSRTPNPVSRDSLLTVLDAFLALYGLRTEGASQRDTWYVGHVPPDCRPTTATRAGRFHQVTSDIVRQTVTETRRHVSDCTTHATVCTPLMAGRNISGLLEESRSRDSRR